jgi:MFS family permease
VAEIAVVAAIYPGVWGIGQIAAGAWSDRVGRKPLIVSGMLLQAAALGVLAASEGFALAAVAAVALGVGTALVYPTLIAAISDQVAPVARASTIGVYRFWRDMGYVIGGLLAGVAADVASFEAAVALVAGLTAVSGLWVLLELPHEELPVPVAGEGLS